MMQLVPNRMLFDFEFPLRFVRKPPALDGSLTGWNDALLLPDLGDIDGVPSFGQVWACWNEEGLFIACSVRDKKRKLACNPKAFWKGDNLRLCTDMRDTRNIKRATKFCQQFYLLPAGAGRDGSKPVAGSAPIHRARAAAPPLASDAITLASRLTADGYTLTAHLSARALSGFDPREHKRIGFFYILEDLELGQQYLTVGDDLYWHIDPSTWPTAVLLGA